MRLSDLAGRLRKYGLTVVECAGWSSRGFLGRDLIEVRGVLWHHTATNRARFADSDAPTLKMCIEGRPDVAGPLCNIVFGRNGTVYLVAAGLANHAGAGAWTNIPRDLGNYYLIGIEMESSGIAPWDWTADQLRVAPYLGAALELECLGWLPPDLRLQIGHMEYSSQGKIDPAGWPGGMDGLRSSINQKLSELAGGALAPAGSINEEDDMAVTPSFEPDVRGSLQNITDKINKLPALDRDLRARLDILSGFEHDVRADLANKGAELAALRAAVVALADKQEGVSTEEVLAAVQAGVEKFTESYRLSVQRVEVPAPAEEEVDNGQA